MLDAVQLTEITVTSLLDNTPFLPSPHCDRRPRGELIDALVIHGISLPAGIFSGAAIHDLFCGRLTLAQYPSLAALVGLSVSAHVLIRRNGQCIQYVPFDWRAWHAGISSLAGRCACNDFSIGIELEGADDIPYTKVQYQQLVELTYLLMQRYPDIVRSRIVGHSDIAPGRKTDPGPAFEWSYYDDQLKQRLLDD